MLELINNGGIIAGAVAIILAGFRTNTARVWKDEAEAQKTRADRLISELEEVKRELESLKEHTEALVRLLSTIDPQKLEELTPRGR